MMIVRQCGCGFAANQEMSIEELIMLGEAIRQLSSLGKKITEAETANAAGQEMPEEPDMSAKDYMIGLQSLMEAINKTMANHWGNGSCPQITGIDLSLRQFENETGQKTPPSDQHTGQYM